MKRTCLIVAVAAACGGPTKPPAAGPSSGPLVIEPPAPPAPPEPPAPTEPATAELVDGQIVLSQPIVFATGGDAVAEASAAPLAALAEFLTAKPALTLVRIEVHSDATGGTEFNQRMSEARALAAARALVARGVDCTRLIPVGFGETKPVADNRSLEGRAANRRTVIAPAALMGRLIGGMPADGGGVVAGDPCQ